MNKRIIMNLISLVVTVFLLIFVINAWFVTNETAKANGILGKSSSDGFTLDLEHGTYSRTASTHWTWASTNDLSINNMEPNDAFFFRFKVNASSSGKYKISLSDISSKLLKNQNGGEILQRVNFNGEDYVGVYGNPTFKMDYKYKVSTDTTVNPNKKYFTRSGSAEPYTYTLVDNSTLYDSETETYSFADGVTYYDLARSTTATINYKETVDNVLTNKSAVLYEYDEEKEVFTLKDFLVEDSFRFYKYGVGNATFMENKTNIISGNGLTGQKLDEVNAEYDPDGLTEFYVYFALEFNEAASLKNYYHTSSNQYSSDSNLFQNQILTIGHFGLELK